MYFSLNDQPGTGTLTADALERTGITGLYFSGSAQSVQTHGTHITKKPDH